jgi:hypothetical protein
MFSKTNRPLESVVVCLSTPPQVSVMAALPMPAPVTSVTLPENGAAANNNAENAHPIRMRI